MRFAGLAARARTWPGRVICRWLRNDYDGRTDHDGRVMTLCADLAWRVTL
jgi:hypothetical protein